MTTDAPTQFSDDDRTLLRQLFALVQNIDARLSNFESSVNERLSLIDGRLAELSNFESSVNERLSSIDGRLAETNKLDKIIGAVADLKEEIRDLRRDFRTLDKTVSQDRVRNIDIEERIEQIERRLNPEG